jgi:predicted enzyme related to lactoylglutathione lyase
MAWSFCKIGPDSAVRRLCIVAGLALQFGFSHALAQSVAVGPQYDSTHVYVAPGDLERFATSFLGTVGGVGSKPVVTTVTPTPSRTTSQVLKTPGGLVSIFAFSTPIPAPFGAERTGYLVTDLDAAVRAARSAGADVVVEPFPDPIGKDAIIQWPGGVFMQLYWHTTAPSYAPLQYVPENRVYVSADRVEALKRDFLQFSQGKVASDDSQAPGIEIGRPGGIYRRIRIESLFGRLTIIVTDGHLAYPYGRETTGYEVDDLDATLQKGKALGVVVLVAPYASEGRRAAIVQFPGGHIAEIHSALHR